MLDFDVAPLRPPLLRLFPMAIPQHLCDIGNCHMIMAEGQRVAAEEQRVALLSARGDKKFFVAL